MMFSGYTQKNFISQEDSRSSPAIIVIVNLLPSVFITLTRRTSWWWASFFLWLFQHLLAFFLVQRVHKFCFESRSKCLRFACIWLMLQDKHALLLIIEMFCYITWAQKERAFSIPCQVEVIHMPQLLLPWRFTLFQRLIQFLNVIDSITCTNLWWNYRPIYYGFPFFTLCRI